MLKLNNSPCWGWLEIVTISWNPDPTPASLKPNQRYNILSATIYLKSITPHTRTNTQTHTQFIHIHHKTHLCIHIRPVINYIHQNHQFKVLVSWQFILNFTKLIVIIIPCTYNHVITTSTCYYSLELH